MTFARRIQAIEPFLAVEVAERAQELERSGIDVVHLEFGEPDFEAPPVVRDALERAIKDGRTRYAHSLGILPLREAIAEHIERKRSDKAFRERLRAVLERDREILERLAGS